jgi:hypothetical protein
MAGKLLSYNGFMATNEPRQRPDLPFGAVDTNI